MTKKAVLASRADFVGFYHERGWLFHPFCLPFCDGPG